jgi:putative copper export protein
MIGDALLGSLFLVKIGFYASALTASGLALHSALRIVEGERLKATLDLTAVVATIAFAFCATRLLLINAQLGVGIADAFNEANFVWTWRMQGPAALAMTGGAAALALSFFFAPRLLMGIGALAIAASFALTGHSQALEPAGFAPWAVAAHALIAAFWFAAPITLWPRSDLTDEDLLERNRRFGVFAVAAIPILIALGVWLLWRLAGSVEAAVRSFYGQLLIAKLIVASVALGLGAFNKFTVTTALQDSPVRGRVLLARTLTLDALLFMTALGLVGWATTMTGPPEM